MIYALDTNIIIRILRNESPVRQNFNDAVIQGHSIVIPKIVDYEIKRGFRVFYAPNKELAYSVLTGEGICDIVEIDNNSWEIAELVYDNLYRKGHTIGELDILIAAICLCHDYILVTNNTRHFKEVEGLSIEDWIT